MGNCGSFPKTKGDEAVPAPEPRKEESIKVDNENSNDQENVTKVEEEEKTITTDDSFNAEKNNSDLDLHDGDEAKPALDDDKNAQSLQTLLVENGGKGEKGDEESEKKVEVEVASEAKEEAKEEKEVEAVKLAEKVEEKTTNKAEPEKAFEPAAPVADIPAATIQ
ncbi:uncharacterized protein LOC133783972 [Humulus lupulus]|uniref:uncharacterized protein LOC133783972 n=1 Tax=Humulus lupulus TaxID=3486 RepID=UPI002B405F91|nr:uncharacterized protein LOC133783972 [Humulus lupulus]